MKLSPERVHKERPMRGELTLEHFYGRMIARLTYPWYGPPGPGTKLPTLTEVHLHRIKGNSLVLHGNETIGMLHEQRTVRQAWWCTVLPESERPTKS